MNSVKCLIVLGMGRSGTSFTAYAASLLGVDFGTRLISPDHFNPNGYFEDVTLCSINHNLLNQIGSYLGDFTSYNDAWWVDKALSPLYMRAREFLAEKAEKGHPFGLKDPRMCRLIPFWLNALSELQIIPTVMLVIRDPLSVSRSLVRQFYSVNHSLLWWLRYNIEAESATRGLNRELLYFPDDYKNVDAISTRFARYFCVSDDWVASLVAAFDRDRQLPRSEDGLFDHAAPNVYNVCLELYRTLRKLNDNGPQEVKHLEVIAGKVDAICRENSGWRDSYRHIARHVFSKLLNTLDQTAPERQASVIQSLREAAHILEHAEGKLNKSMILRLLFQNLELDID